MSIQKTIPILSNCRSCDSDSLTLATTRKKFPLYIWPLPKSESTRLEDIQLYVCNECGYIQLQNMDQQTIVEIYRDKAFNIENEGQNINRYKTLISGNKSKFDNTKVLEVGGGRNSFLKNIPGSAEKWAADFDIEKKLLPVLNGTFKGDFLDIDIDQNNFDYVFMFHVLEHFNNPGLALQKVRGLLNNKGRLIIEVPNFAFESKQRPYYTIFHMHISLFIKESLLSILTRCGFNCIDMFTVNDVLLAEFSLSDYKTSENCKENSLRYLNDLKSNIDKCYFSLQRLFEKLSDYKIAIFGAGGATSLFLYSYPLLIERISYAFDNDQNKIGRYICNGKIPVVSPVNFEEKIDYVIVLEENHIQRMKNNNISYINIRDYCYD